MKKDNLILLLLVLIVLMLGYQIFLLKSASPSTLSEKKSSEAEAPEQAPESRGNSNPYANADLKTDVFVNEDKSFGYQVFLNGSPMIRQPNIPGLPGNAGFRDEAKAKKTADLVLLKIRRNIMPPAITTEELDSLGVL
jgi:hypothetical protein